MDRRNFLRTLVGGVAITAAARTWPFRVYSFPAQPSMVIANDLRAAMRKLAQEIDRAAYEYGEPSMVMHPEQFRAYLQLGGIRHIHTLDTSTSTFAGLKRSPLPWLRV